MQRYSQQDADMLTLKKICVWAVERAIEIISGAFILLGVFGTNSNSRYPGVAGDLYINSIFVLGFYIASGFVVSTIYFGLAKRIGNPVLQSGAMAGYFLVHVLLFMLIGRIEPAKIAVVALLGAGAVALASFVGSVLLGRSGEKVNIGGY